ncbi:MAG: insulinase family protein [Pseudomonadota bacterium]|nr:insulinase family protein [Pseudomonadota bacterium]
MILPRIAACVLAASLGLAPLYVSSQPAAPASAPAKAAPAKDAVTPAKAGAQSPKLAPPPQLPGQRVGSQAVKFAEVEGITEHRLPNGLKVLMFPDPSKPTVTVNITYLVGSRHENYGETGMAHLLEHLLFKGTPKHPTIDAEFNKRGARFNGTTWLDRTNYYELFQASDDNLAWAIELEADRMVNSFIAKKDLDSEMTVVRNEYESGENSPFGVMFKRLQSIAYDWHSYGRSTIGNRSDIENVRIENLQAFYRTYYQPDNAVLLIAGKFEPAKALALVSQHFGKIPKPNRKLPPEWTVEPTQDGPREFTVRRKGDIQIVGLAYKVPSSLHADSDSVGVGGYILSHVPTGRLHKALVETGKAAQVFGFPVQGKHPGLQLFGAVVKKGDSVEAVRDELIKIVEGFADNPPTKTEMERTKLSFLNAAEKTLANHESIGVQMSEYIALGDWRLFFLARDELEKMTTEQVATASRAYFRRDNRTVGFFLPEDNPLRAEIPAAPTLAEVMKDFKPKTVTSVAEAFDPSQANLDARTKRLEFGGVKVALLSKKNRGETVNVAIALHLGNERALFDQRTNASMAARMLARGTTKYSRADLSDQWERLKVSGRVQGPSTSLQTTRPNLEETLRLAVHVMREPSFDATEFEQLRNQTITGIEAQLSEPEARAGEELSKHFNVHPKGDWRYSPTLAESLAETRAAKLEDAKRFHSEFYGAQMAEVAIVGDFDETRVVALLKELLGDWKPKTPYERVTNEFREIPAADKSVATPDKENAVFIARQNMSLRDDDPDYPALYVANYILGGASGFESRLMTRIRQKDGLSYGVGSDLSVPALDRAASWSAYAIAAPANIAKVEAAFREEIARALKDGFTEAELASAKSGMLQARVQSRSQDSSVASGWTSNLFLGRTYAFSKQFEDKVMALKVSEVSAALRKYLDPSKITVVKAGDFTKK